MQETETKKAVLYRPGTKPKKRFEKYFGYDTETSDNNQHFDVGCFSLDDNSYIQMTTREEIISKLKTKTFRNCVIGAHNLSFDFHATFKGIQVAKWHTIYSKGGGMLAAYTYVVHGEFSKEPDTSHYHKITFIDTMNFAQMSLRDMAKIIGEKKYDWDFSKDSIKCQADLERFYEYNRQDANIARKFLIYLSKSFFMMGSNLKLTLASTSEKIFRNVYLNRIYEQQPIEQMNFNIKVIMVAELKFSVEG